jgi:hypothetical protein
MIYYESITLYEPVGYYWVANSTGQIGQAFLYLFNDGTKYVAITQVWVNDTIVNATRWGGESISAMNPNGGTPFYVAPDWLIYERGKTYVFTFGTSTGKRFSLSLKTTEDHIKKENLTIVDCHFMEFWDESYVSLRLKNGPTYAIVTEVTVNGAKYPQESWFMPNQTFSVLADPYWWYGNKTYVITVKTAAGNTSEILKKTD